MLNQENGDILVLYSWFNYQRIFKHIEFNQENGDMFFRYFAWFSQKRMGFEFGGSPVPWSVYLPGIQGILEATHMWKRRPPSSLDEWLRYKHDHICISNLVLVSLYTTKLVTKLYKYIYNYVISGRDW